MKNWIDNKDLWPVLYMLLTVTIMFGILMLITEPDNGEESDKDQIIFIGDVR